MAPGTIASELDRLAQEADRACQPAQADLFTALLSISHQLPALASAVEIGNAGLAYELDRLARYLDERKTVGRFGFVDYAAVLKVTAECLHELAAAAGNGTEDGLSA